MSGKYTASGVESASWKAQGTFAVKEILASLERSLSSIILTSSTVITILTELVGKLTDSYDFGTAELPDVFARARLVEDRQLTNCHDLYDQLDVQVYIPLNSRYVWALTAHIVDNGEARLTGCVRCDGERVGSESVDQLESELECDLIDAYKTLRRWFA